MTTAKTIKGMMQRDGGLNISDVCDLYGNASEEERLAFNMGCWAQSKMTITSILKTLEEYDCEDCEDEPFGLMDCD